MMNEKMAAVLDFVEKQYTANPKRTIALGIFAFLVIGALLSAVFG